MATNGEPDRAADHDRAPDHTGNAPNRAADHTAGRPTDSESASGALESFACPLPLRDSPRILLAHGGGGRLMHELIERVFVPCFGNPILSERHDGARLALADYIPRDLSASSLAFTTDSYVVRPLFFPGGDIGSLAVNGTVNDLAMCGARPIALSAAFILEEGLPMDVLWRVACSMRDAARDVGVPIVTGDTKVVDRGKADGIFVNTAGIGVIPPGVHIAPSRIRPGDAVLVSGDLGRHGIAVMALREGLEFEAKIESDCAPLLGCVQALLAAGIEVHALRDLTRGGLTSALVELAEAAQVGIRIDEAAIPVGDTVRAACEMLGLDPLSVANEGRFVAFVAERDGDRALEILRALDVSRQASRIGRTEASDRGRVALRTCLGVYRRLDMLSGEQLPRIC